MSSRTTKNVLRTNDGEWKMNDNSCYAEKLKLRLDNLPADKKLIRVLDCFAGQGTLWKAIKKLRPDIDIAVLSIDSKRKTRSAQLTGNNLKFLPTLNLNNFDVIDLDAYGVPVQQLCRIFDAAAKPVVFGTFVMAGPGRIPFQMLSDLGYSPAMFKKKPQMLFNYKQDEKFLQWLALKGVKRIRMYAAKHRRNLYFCINY